MLLVAIVDPAELTVRIFPDELIYRPPRSNDPAESTIAIKRVEVDGSTSNHTYSRQ